MKELTLPIPEMSPEANNAAADTGTERKNNARRKRWKIGLYLSISAACLLGLTGLIISGLYYIDVSKHTKLIKEIGTVLVLFAAPLYFLAAHCLDMIDPRKKSD